MFITRSVLYVIFVIIREDALTFYSFLFSFRSDTKKDFSTAILERKKSPNRLTVDEVSHA
jgi:hypothetical protein